MNLEIKKRIDLIDNPDVIQLFFELLKDLIEKTNISNDDERIALNIRNDDKKRFSVNINSRLVLMINNEILAVMINDDDLHQISHLNIFNKEIFEKQNNASLVYFNYQTVHDNIELIQPLFVKSCLDYLPLQSKSQYRRYHIDELFNIAMNDSLLNEYLNNVIIEDYLKFNEIINNLRVYLLGENNILKDFKITEVKDNSRWVWISDNQNMIGDTIAHYEIISRRNKIYTEIHFEGNQESKDNFYQNISSLAENIEWFTWQNSKSIRFNKVFSFDEENLIKKLADSLLYLEENIGDKVREIINTIHSQSTINKKLMEFPLNQILYGPPGTGKTYNTINKAIEIANPEFKVDESLEEKDKRKIIKQEYNSLVEEGQIVFTTFHQSMTYEDFIEGIKPETKDNNVIYNIKNGLFKEAVSKSIDNWKKSTSGTKQTKPFDKVFQLLKDEWEENPMIEFPMKREGNDFKILGFSDSSISFLKASGTNNHTLSINTLRDLYYGIREFQNQGVGIYYPSIVDKLNSYDVDFESESINSDIKNFVIVIDEINRGNVSQIFGELITLIEEDKRLGNDEAIEVTLPYSKEKFGVPSNLYIIGTMNTADRSVEALDTALRRRFVFEEIPPKYNLEGLQQDLFGFTASHLLETINKRIEKLLDKDHQIGHAYFLNKDENTIVNSFYKNIIPLLQEYFFGDYGKIGLVLGSGFVDVDNQNQENQRKSIFASFGYEDDISAYEERKSYKILGLNDEDFDFGSAIKLLMNQ
ncbi:McrB family protein [Empedobacter sp. UBA5987]|uniref:McrB family protein n=1 Tax=Empedobacter sp. UBA5987 TaxID=1946444 RepID=UPI0025BC68F1|nr:AAA family ATPase [Empedobacter sp. UBA5987]